MTMTGYDNRGGGKKIRCRALCFALCLAFYALLPLPVFAQERSADREDFWAGFGADTAMYSLSGMAYGGGVALGYGSGLSIGLKGVFLVDADKVITIETNVLLRYYLLGARVCSGPFIQINGGPAFFMLGGGNQGGIALANGTGIISAGGSFGWRFLLGHYLYIEPAVRAGYPYFAGAAISAGFHF